MFGNLKLGVRLSLGFGLILALMGVVAFFASRRVATLDASIKVVVEERMTKTAYATTLIGCLQEYVGAVANMVLTDDPEIFAREDSRRAPISACVSKMLENLEKTAQTQEEKVLLERVTKVRAPFRKAVEDLVALARVNDDKRASEILFGDLNTHKTEYVAALQVLIAWHQEKAQADGAAAAALADATVKVLAGLSILALVLGILGAYLITRSIVVPLARCIEIADGVANGKTDFDIQVTTREETGKLLRSLRGMVEAIRGMVGDVDLLAASAMEGRLGARVAAETHRGDFRRIVEGVNGTLDSLVGYLDNMPAPCMIIDRDYRILYMNKAGASLAETTGEALVASGARCRDHFRTGDCGTARCACNRAMSSGNAEASETRARPGKHELDIEYTGVPIRDHSGQVIGAFEVVNDLTAIRRAGRLAEKKSAYQTVEVERLTCNLQKVAEGRLDLDLAVEPGDEETQDVRESFLSIAMSLDISVQAIGSLVQDADLLVQAALVGDLGVRADADRHQGEFRNIVEGFNNTLDAVILPINEAARVMERVAARDLTSRVEGAYRGDLARIKETINTAIDNLENALSQVTQSTLQVSGASQQISAGSQSLAQGANEQASSIEEMTSTMAEMATMTRRNAEGARRAKILAGEADANAQAGGDAMERMTFAIAKIKESADQTAKIVKTIDEIAMQTNLLALNAAVEAARAGDAGRGFAVVAEEVRNLASRSAQAAKNTADMLEESGRNAEGGVDIACEVAEVFSRIATNSKEVNVLITEIAEGSREQSTGIEQVSAAVSQMDKVTQQTAANAEESASSSEELSAQAEELQAMVAQFRLRERTGSTGSVHVPRGGIAPRPQRLIAIEADDAPSSLGDWQTESEFSGIS